MNIELPEFGEQVVDHLSSLDYKGTGFIQQLAEHVTVESETEYIRDQVFRMWMIMACAAADYAESTPNKEVVAQFDSMLILVGEQGVGKTMFFRAMLPKELRQYFNDGVFIDLNDSDLVSQCLQNWITETTDLQPIPYGFNCFLSKSIDTYREPYEQFLKSYQRRTVFVGSTNEREFLNKMNRRFWPLFVEAITIPTDEDLINNAWAEAWTAYTSGEQWWPQADFEEKLSKHQAVSFQTLDNE